MRWRAGEPPKKSWASCAVFWTNTRGEPDEHRSELDFARGFADSGLDVAAFHLAGRGAGGAVCGGSSSLPKRLGTVRAGRRRAPIEAGIASHHVHAVEGANNLGRYDSPPATYDVARNLHPTRDRPL